MPLPELIEIVPLGNPIQAVVTVPGSKSLTNRALILAALADGRTTLRGALWSEDTQVMVEALRKLGFAVEVATDPVEACNRHISINGLNGRIPRGGTRQNPLDLFVGNAGTAARFLAALVCLGSGAYRLHGVPRMHDRPQAALFQALRELGYPIDSPNDRLPAVIHGAGPRPARCRVSIEESSQFASALFLCSKTGGWEVEVVGENSEESPYVAMTSKLVSAFPKPPAVFPIEPDASSASYFWAAGWLNSTRTLKEIKSTQVKHPTEERTLAVVEQGEVIVPSCRILEPPVSDWQIDSRFPRFLPLPPTLSRRTQLGDSIMTAIVLAPLAEHPVRFTDLGRLRVQECERVAALRTELTKCGGRVLETGDTLEVFPSTLHGAEIDTYHDHRMAMCFAILGLKVPGLRIKNPACVKKTFPNFFQKLAAPVPQGLGAAILDAATRRPLGVDELFAGEGIA